MPTAAYQSPGMTLAEVEAAVAAHLTLSVADSDDLALIDQAVTIAGQAATMWKGMPWWWAQTRATFSTIATKSVSKVARTSNVATITTSAVHGLIAGCVVKVSGVTTAGFNETWAVVVAAASTTTFTYANTGDDVVEVADATGSVVCFGFPLRTVNSSAMTAFLAATGVRYGTSHRLRSNMGWEAYQDLHATEASSGNGTPYNYIVNGDDPTMYFWNLPTAAATITVSYIKRHSKITSAGSTDAALTVPAEYHYSIYVDGAVFAIRNRVMAPQGMYQNPDFVEALETMWGGRPEDYDLNSQERGGSELPSLPADRHVLISGDGNLSVTP